MLSSHLVANLERVCDYLVVLVDSRVQLAGDVEELLAQHHRLVGPRREAANRRRVHPGRVLLLVGAPPPLLTARPQPHELRVGLPLADRSRAARFLGFSFQS